MKSAPCFSSQRMKTLSSSPFAMRDDWEELDFESCLKKVNKTTKIPKKNFLVEGKYPIISQEDEFINGFWNEEKDVFKIKKPVVIFGDHTKKIKYVDFDFVLGADGVKVLLPLDHINTRYFYYHLQALELDDLGYARHYRLLRGKKISVPPLSEQEEIVAILDEAFAAIDRARANIEKNIENANELFQSRLNEIFSQKGDGWEEKKLGSLIEIKHGFAFKSEFFSDKGEFVLLTPGNFFESGGYRDRGDKQKYYVGEIPEGFILNENDLLVAMTEQAPGLLGSPLIVPSSNRFLHNQRLGLIKTKEGINLLTEFLFYIFNTKHFRNAVYQSGTGVKVRHTSPSKIMAVKVNVNLSDCVQRDVINKLNTLSANTNSIKIIYRAKLETLEELKKSLLQKAFSGELT